MSNFNTSYTTPLDRGYYTEFISTEPAPEQHSQKPIVPVKDLGITVVEKDPRTGANILQNVQAAIRQGASNIQLVLTTPASSAIGGRPKAYGEEVREAIREVARANDLHIGGVEMSTQSHTNMSGFDRRSGFSEQQRHEDMLEVKDAIKLVADVAGGGGVDIWSQEFPRTIFDADFNKKGKWANQFFEHPKEDEEAVKHLVDPETGKIIESIRVGNSAFVPEWNTATEEYVYLDPATGAQTEVKPGDWIDYDGAPIRDSAKRVPKFDADKGEFVIREKKFNEFSEEAKILTERKRREFKEQGRVFTQDDVVTTEEAVFIAQAEGRAAELRGHAGQSASAIKERLETLNRIQKARDIYRKIEEAASEEEKEQLMREVEQGGLGLRELNALGIHVPSGNIKKLPTQILDEQIYDIKRSIQNSQELSTGYNRQAREAEKRARNVQSIGKFAKKKTFDSYAELGIHAMIETDSNPHAKKPLYVGPELGWPGQWGGHPDEFIELVKESRKTMAKKLVEEYNYGKHEAEQKAKMHIKGLFDTSHMGMWLRNFKRNKGESDSSHQKRFNKWYLEMTDKLIQSGTVGSIQAVDSASGAHGHLPPGQGIFPIVEAVERFKKAGFDGFIVSEGHEEEQFGHGRIMTQTWKAFGSPFGSVPFTSGASTWRGISQGYFGRTYTPNFLVAGYAPSNDFKLWSEVPLE